MRDAPISEDRLQAAKDNVTGAFALRFSNTTAIAQMLVAIQRQDLGIDYIDERNSFFQSVTLEDIRRVAQKLLDPNALTVVVVGKPEGITPTKPAPDNI